MNRAAPSVASTDGGRQPSTFHFPSLRLLWLRRTPFLSLFTSMKQLLLILLLTVFCGLGAQAQQTQTFTRQLQEQVAGQGTVVLIQDEEITTLVNNTPVGTPIVVTPKAKPEKATKPNGKPESGKNNTTPTKPEAGDKAHHNPTHPAPGIDNKTPEKPAAPSTYTGRRARQKVQGFRIQVFAGSGAQAKKTAKAMEAKIRRAFPELAVYCHFMSPRWVCRAGDFATRAEAQRYLTKLRNQNISNEATIVSDQVFVVK